MAEKVYLEWEKVNQNWEDVHQVWEEVILIQEVARAIGGSGGISEYVKNNPWQKLNEQIGEEKTKKFIKIFARVNGIEYESVLESKTETKVTVSQFQKVFDETEKIGVKITF
jgi:hypothetical protein